MSIRVQKYFWAGLTPTNQLLTQFTLDGAEQLWKDILKERKIIRVYWLPFDHDMAHAAILSKQPFMPEVSKSPALWLDVPPGDVGVPQATHDYERFTYWECEDCGGKIFLADETVRLVCPHCGSKNEWYCNTCHKVIENPIFLPKNVVNCPVCQEKGDPRGCVRTKALSFHKDTDNSLVYSLALNNKFAFEYDENGVFLRKYKCGDLLKGL